jgi:ribosomal protein S18 acetylase RimI-like enzyme
MGTVARLARDHSLVPLHRCPRADFVTFRRLGAGEVGPGLVDTLAPWVIAASRPFADWYFGQPDVAAEIVTEWMARPTSELYVGRAIVYDDEQGWPGGCIIALPGHEVAAARAADFGEFCAEIASEPEADEVIAEVVTVSRELFPPIEPDDLYVSRVGVDEAQRGKGVGRALVEAAIEEFRERGIRGCRLDVSADNRAAIRAYEAAGLAVVSTSHSPISGLTYCAMRAGIET